MILCLGIGKGMLSTNLSDFCGGLPGCLTNGGRGARVVARLLRNLCPRFSHRHEGIGRATRSEWRTAIPQEGEAESLILGLFDASTCVTVGRLTQISGKPLAEKRTIEVLNCELGKISINLGKFCTMALA